MKKFYLIILIFFAILLQNIPFEDTSAQAMSKSKSKKAKYLREMQRYEPKKDLDYPKIYKNLETIKVNFIHDEDPDEYYDTQKIHFSPYPLIRLTHRLYVKNNVIEPGFYLLTPREYDGKKCVLFKEAGKVKHVVPVFEYKKIDPDKEYQKPPKKWWQIRDRYTFQTQYYERKIRAFDVYADFFEIDLYYRDGLSKMIFKKNPY